MEIKTHLDFCFVPVPEGVHDFAVAAAIDSVRDDLPPGSWQLLAISDEVTEGVAKGIVDIHEECSYWDSVNDIFYKNYSEEPFCTSTALDSFRSLLSAAGVQGRVAVLKKLTK